MEQSPQDQMHGLSRAPVNPASLPPEYWANLDSLYSNGELAHQHPPPTQQPQGHQAQQSQPEALGIDWNHPIFSQQQQLPQQPSRSPLPPQPQDQSHGLYTSHTPQSWRGNTMQSQQAIAPAPAPTPQGYGISPQYRHIQPYSHGQVALDSRSLSTPENPAFQQTFTYPQNYYPRQHMSVPDAFHQSSSAQAALSQPTNANANPFSNDTASTPIGSYNLPSGFPEDSLHTPMQFTHDFPEVAPNLPTHQTIDPQFINGQQSTSQQHSSMNNFLYVNTPDFQRQSEPQMFDYFRNDLQLGSLMNQAAPNNAQNIARSSNVQVVLPANGQRAAVSKIPGQPVEPKKKAPSAKKPTQKAATKASGKRVDRKGSVSSSSESETDDSELEIESPEEPSPIPPSRPTNAEGAAQYDTLKAVWSPRNRRPNVGKVKDALTAFKDVVKAVRDVWKEKTQAMKTAENKNENEKAAQIKEAVVLQRRLMDVVVSTTLDKGHPMIVEKLGEHPMAVAAIYSFLLDRHQAADIDGAFNTNLLKLLARFITVDEDTLNKTNVAKLLPRFVKKGGSTVKELSQKILDNAAAATKRKQGAGKTSSKESSPSKPVPVGGQRNETAGSKRPREGESNGQPATKRVVLPSNSKNALKPSNTVANGAAKRPQEPGQDKAASVPARPKANIIAPKPTNLFGTLGSASKRPGTSNAERAAAAAAAAAAKPSTLAEKKEPQPAPPRPTFSFGDLMADLNKQKEPAKEEPAEERPPETEEERKKRLRKESRRKLRVSWKPDHSLTEVRFFTHDPDEELGPGDRSREAGDVKGEGSVLKLHRDLDEDDDEDAGIREENLLDYHETSEIDLEDIEDRSAAFIKRAGQKQPDSPEKIAQERREATTLMVFYTSPADIPSTPKEPPPSEGEEPAPEVVSFGELPDHVKARQERYYAVVNPKRVASSQPATQPAPQGPSFDFSNLFKVFNNANQQPVPQHSTPPPQPVSQAPMSDLERTISMFRQQQQPQVSNPLAQMPQFPTMPQAAATPGIDFQQILSVFNSQNQMQQPPIVPQAQQSQPSIPSNLAAIVSQLSAQNQQAPANVPQQPTTYEDPERKRMRESGGGYDGPSDDKYNYPKRPKSGAPNKKHPKAGLVACRYWAEGRCRKGDDCTYRHDPLN